MPTTQEQQKPMTANNPGSQTEKLKNTPIQEPKEEKDVEHQVDGQQGFAKAGAKPNPEREVPSKESESEGAEDARMGTEDFVEITKH